MSYETPQDRMSRDDHVRDASWRSILLGLMLGVIFTAAACSVDTVPVQEHQETNALLSAGWRKTCVATQPGDYGLPPNATCVQYEWTCPDGFCRPYEDVLRPFRFPEAADAAP